MAKKDSEATEPIAHKVAASVRREVKKSKRPERSQEYKDERKRILLEAFKDKAMAEKAYKIEEEHEFRTHWMLGYRGFREEMGE